MKQYSLKPKEFSREFNDDFFAMSEIRAAEKERFVNDFAVRFYLTAFFSLYVTEHAFVFFFNKKRKLLDKMHIQGDGAEYCYPLTESIENRGRELRASSFIIAHNHPGTSALPSVDDEKLTEKIRNYFSGKKLKFEDHYIVSGSKVRPMYGGIGSIAPQ